MLLICCAGPSSFCLFALIAYLLDRKVQYFSMYLEFQELRGAAGDVQELEFISALHQTDEEGVRVDASIEGELSQVKQVGDLHFFLTIKASFRYPPLSFTAQDVRLFLMSRYGIKVTEEEVRNTIFDGMAGGNGATECLEYVAKFVGLSTSTGSKSKNSHIFRV